MALYLVHRVLVTSAIALGALFALHSAGRYRATGEPLAAGLVALSVLASLGLALYLRRFLGRARAAASR